MAMKVARVKMAILIFWSQNAGLEKKRFMTSPIRVPWPNDCPIHIKRRAVGVADEWSIPQGASGAKKRQNYRDLGPPGILPVNRGVAGRQHFGEDLGEGRCLESTQANI